MEQCTKRPDATISQKRNTQDNSLLPHAIANSIYVAAHTQFQLLEITIWLCNKLTLQVTENENKNSLTKKQKSEYISIWHSSDVIIFIA